MTNKHKQKNMIKITVEKEELKSALTMADMMIASGALYDEHPILILLKNIYTNLKLNKKVKLTHTNLKEKYASLKPSLLAEKKNAKK